ncbi:hypothetical protein HDV04_004626, partial [Boothiomyces sp. JEL0838]
MLKRLLIPTITKRFNSSLPFPDSLSKALNPVGYVKWKMGVIDAGRTNYEECAQQFEKLDLKLPSTFQSWFSVTILHVWMINKRLSLEGELGRDLQKEMINHIWLDAEIKLHQAGVKAKINSIVSDLVGQYQGNTLGYDEGLFYGDQILAGALWRNIYNCENVEFEKILNLLTIVRQRLHYLDKLDSKTVMD